MTIRRRIFLSFLALLVVPVFLIGFAMAAVRAFYEGREAAGHPVFLSSFTAGEALGSLNRRILEDPDSLLDGNVLAGYASERPYRAAAVLREGRLAAVYPEEGTAEIVEEVLAAGFRRGFGHRHFLSFRWDFTFSGGEPGTFLLIGGFGPHGGSRVSGLLFLAGLAGLLFLVNGLITWLAAGKIAGPLRRLEEAAARIGAGDLDKPAEPTGDKEIREVFAAFETMRKELKASLEKQLALERNRRELVAALSHDLRTPITAIRGYVEGLRDGIPKDEEARRRYLAVVDEKARLLDRLIGDLFLFSRMELQGFCLEREKVDLAGFVAAAVEEIGEEHPWLRIVWTRRDAGAASVDRDHLRRAVRNICENSLRHGKAGTLELSVEASPDVLRIRIADDGGGIAPGEEDLVFAGLYRGDGSRNQRDGGSGLGLAVVRQVLEAHGGRAWAERLSPRGLAVILELPAPEAANG